MNSYEQNEQISHISRTIEQTLDSYGINVRIVEVNSNKDKTIQFCMEIKSGTIISDIEKYKREIALAVASPTGKVIIEAPIPGRALVGITVPINTLNEKKPVHIESKYPHTILGKGVNVVASIFQVIANILYFAVDTLEHMKGIANILLVIILVPTVYIFLTDGNFNLNRNLDYSLVIFIAWIVMIGVRQRDISKEKK